jgi:hypothetical protein
MTPAETPVPDQSERGGDRGGDRRGDERRRLDRRTPPPYWRRPWALVAYGALAGVLVVGWLTSGREGGRDQPIVERGPTTLPAKQPPPVASAAPQAAYGVAGFERLTLEGTRAVGRRVHAELYCEQPTSYQVREGVNPEAAVAALASGGRVPAADCKWGAPEDTRREDFVLLVPPDLADQFAAAPLVTDQFQRRRRVRAELEWIGRSEALSLRAAGVFRGITR